LRSQNRAAMAALLDSFVLLLSRSGTCRELTPEELAAQYRAQGEGPGLLTLCALALALRPRLVGLAGRYAVDPEDIVYTHLASAAGAGAVDLPEEVRTQLHNGEVGTRRREARERAYQVDALEPHTAPQGEESALLALAQSRLTPEEREVGKGLEAGFTQEEIAAQLGVTVRTVERRVASLRKKLGPLLSSVGF
jgi:predicted DNA-binding protein (UPF0251 family)